MKDINVIDENDKVEKELFSFHCFITDILVI